MSGRSFFSNAEFTSQGLVLGAFGFQTTNIGTAPSTSKIFGGGGLVGTDGAGNPNSGPTFISSITKTANNGEFFVTLQDGYRAVWFCAANTWAATAIGSADGYQAQVSLPANQGAGRTTAVSFYVTVVNASGVATETAGRTVNCFVVLKDSGNGA